MPASEVATTTWTYYRLWATPSKNSDCVWAPLMQRRVRVAPSGLRCCALWSYYPSGAKVWSWIFWVETGLCDDVCATVSDLGLVAQSRCHTSISFILFLFFFFGPVIVRGCLGFDLRLARQPSCFCFPLLTVLFAATVKKRHGANILQLSIPASDSTTRIPKRLEPKTLGSIRTTYTADFCLDMRLC